MKSSKTFCTAFFITTLTFLCGRSNGANILFYWGFSGLSHRMSVWPLVEHLAENGHNVTFFAPLPPKKPNPKVTEVSSAVVFRVVTEMDFMQKRLRGGPEAIERLWSEYLETGIGACEYALNDPGVLEWINTSPTFDLIVINGLINECAFGLVHKHKAPFIMYGPNALYPWWTETYGLVDEGLPEIQYHMPQDMNFLQRVWNSLRPLYWLFFRTWYTLPKVEKVIRDKLNLPDFPSIAEMEKNASLLLLYTNFIEDYTRSFPPAVLPIGGMHCTNDTKPLPKELSDFIGDGKDGFIYFSFGTHAQPELLPFEIKNIFFKAMERFSNIKFIVKWGEKLDTVAENIKVITWAPQQDLLADSRIRGFISHAGLLGTQEALFHGVPMIVMPLFAEQDYNAERIHSRGRGLRLEICELTLDKLEAAIMEITQNNLYRENSLKISKIFKDRPENPLKSAVWWVEYVLRHKDTSYLHSVGSRKTWYERRQLDVWGFITIILLFCAYLFYILLKLTINAFVRTTQVVVDHSKKHL